MTKMNAFMYVTWLQGWGGVWRLDERERAIETRPWRPSLHLHVMKMTVWGANTEFLSSSFLPEKTLMSISSDGKSIWCINQRPFLSTLLSKTTWKYTTQNPSQAANTHPCFPNGNKTPHTALRTPVLSHCFLSSSGHGRAGAPGSRPDIWCQISSLQLIPRA